MSACAVMIECDFQLQLDAYHDRELDAESRRRFEQHLKDCPTCPGELAAMQALSSRIEAATPDEIRPTTPSQSASHCERPDCSPR